MSRNTNPGSLRIVNFPNTRSVCFDVSECWFSCLFFERACAFPCPIFSRHLSIVFLLFEKFLHHLQQELTEHVKKLAWASLQKWIFEWIFSWRWWCAELGFFFKDCEVSWVFSSEQLLKRDPSPVPRSFPRCSLSNSIKKQHISGNIFFYSVRAVLMANLLVTHCRVRMAVQWMRWNFGKEIPIQCLSWSSCAKK